MGSKPEDAQPTAGIQETTIAQAPTTTRKSPVPHDDGREAGVTTSCDKIHKLKGFTITTRKLPILKAEPIDFVTEKLGFPVPEMIFGDNFVSIEHPESNWSINFNCLDALDRVDKTGNVMLKVSYSQEWQKSR